VVLYISGIEVEAATKRRFRVKLEIGNRDIDIHQAPRKGIINLDPGKRLVSSRCLYKKSVINSVIGRELEDKSNVTLTLKAGYKVVCVPLGDQLEEEAEFKGQEAMEAFWKSTDRITRMLKRGILSVSLSDLSRHNYLRPTTRHNHFQISSLSHCMDHIVLRVRVS
jgi:hypothetical protein